jgi:hypothetical protein
VAVPWLGPVATATVVAVPEIDRAIALLLLFAAIVVTVLETVGALPPAALHVTVTELIFMPVAIIKLRPVVVSCVDVTVLEYEPPEVLRLSWL